jgi:hypothetical protein
MILSASKMNASGIVRPNAFAIQLLHGQSLVFAPFEPNRSNVREANIAGAIASLSLP